MRSLAELSKIFRHINKRIELVCDKNMCVNCPFRTEEEIEEIKELDGVDNGISCIWNELNNAMDNIEDIAGYLAAIIRNERDC